MGGPDTCLPVAGTPVTMSVRDLARVACRARSRCRGRLLSQHRNRPHPPTRRDRNLGHRRTARTRPEHARGALISATCHRGVRALVRVDPDHHRRHQHTPPRHPSRQWGPRRACLNSRSCWAFVPLPGPHRGETRQAGTSFVSQTTPRRSQAVRNYRAEGLPGRRRIRRAPRRRAPRNTTIQMNSKYSRPLATTPTMPSTIATITSSRKRASIRSSAQLGGSAAGQPPFTTGTRLVCQNWPGTGLTADLAPVRVRRHSATIREALLSGD
jgi:hypothetical protein